MKYANEEIANNIANDCKREYLAMENDGGTYDVTSFDDCYRAALEALQLKDRQFAEENKWINVEDELPPFVTIEDGSKYSKPVLCKDKSGGYYVASFVRWHTGHYMWLDGSEEQPNVKFWREIND